MKKSRVTFIWKVVWGTHELNNKTAAFKIANGQRNLRKHHKIPPIKPNRLMLMLFFRKFLSNYNFEGCSFVCSLCVFCVVILKNIIDASDSPYNFPYKSDLAFFICSLFYFKVLYNPLYWPQQYMRGGGHVNVELFQFVL